MSSRRNRLVDNGVGGRILVVGTPSWHLTTICLILCVFRRAYVAILFGARCEVSHRRSFTVCTTNFPVLFPYWDSRRLRVGRGNVLLEHRGGAGLFWAIDVVHLFIPSSSPSFPVAVPVAVKPRFCWWVFRYRPCLRGLTGKIFTSTTATTDVRRASRSQRYPLDFPSHLSVFPDSASPSTKSSFGPQGSRRCCRAYRRIMGPESNSSSR